MSDFFYIARQQNRKRAIEKEKKMDEQLMMELGLTEDLSRLEDQIREVK